MITELGHFALVLAFLVAIVQAVVPLIGAARRWPGWMAVAEPAADHGLAGRKPPEKPQPDARKPAASEARDTRREG